MAVEGGGLEGHEAGDEEVEDGLLEVAEGEVEEEDVGDLVVDLVEDAQFLAEEAADDLGGGEEKQEEEDHEDEVDEDGLDELVAKGDGLESVVLEVALCGDQVDVESRGDLEGEIQREGKLEEGEVEKPDFLVQTVPDLLILLLGDQTRCLGQLQHIDSQQRILSKLQLRKICHRLNG